MPLYHLKPDGFEVLPATTFDVLQVMERADLQRLLKQNLEVVAQDCMVIAEEFSSWEGARRRIDLLAVDKNRNLVIIELKRSEDGGHSELQALRYAAMASMMRFDQAVDAYSTYCGQPVEEARRILIQFLNWEDVVNPEFEDVRIVLVSSDFSKEVTTTVLWLNERELDIRCVRLRPYRFKDDVVIDAEQVIPLPEAAEYQVRVREKNDARREAAARETERDRTRFDIRHDLFVEQKGVNKRKAILTVVLALAHSRVTPEQMMSVIPERGDRFFISVDGEVGEEEFSRQAQVERAKANRSFDPVRWFCRDDELIHSNGRTYAVSNQWGTRTDDVLQRLVRAFPEAGIEVTRAEA